MSLTGIKCATLIALAGLTTAPPAIACSPAPSCWMKERGSYLRSICQGYAKDGKTLRQIAEDGVFVFLVAFGSLDYSTFQKYVCR